MKIRGLIKSSLPHSRKRNTDALRGAGTYEASIKAMKRLNEAGYGKNDPKRRITVMSNPAGAFLSPDQTLMEKGWKTTLYEEHGISFDRLITLNNMPISRYLEWLIDSENLKSYMEKLVRGFNISSIEGLMCRNTISVAWDGKIYDCDFNQMLDLRVKYTDGKPCHINNFDIDIFNKRKIATNRHCFGCAAGQGSSCTGATVKE